MLPAQRPASPEMNESPTLAVHGEPTPGPSARAAEVSPQAGAGGDLPNAFRAAMDDDLAVPQALAVVHDTIRAGNNALASGDIELDAGYIGDRWQCVDDLAG